MQMLHTSSLVRVARRSLLALVAALSVALGLAATSSAADPVNVTPPAVTPAGPVGQGTVLSVQQGTWDATVTTPPVDVWSDCSPANVCTTSSGSTYTVPSDEPAHTIFVTETATDSGTSSTVAVTSNVVTVVEPPSNSTAPSISGTAAQGQTLTADPGTWTNRPTFSYAWQDCLGNGCSPSPTSTNSTTYTVTAADAAGGYAIRVEVTGTNADGFTVADSARTTATTGVPASTGVPTITGTAAGGTLTEVHGAWTNSPTAYTYQWLSCTGSSASTCTAIAGATSQTYAVPAASDGLGYEVAETASNISGSGTAATSAVLIPPPPVNTVVPAITGTIAVGHVLTASTGTWSNGPTAYAYQWQRCSGTPLVCNTISGATASTYKLRSQDAGFTTQVQVTATNAGGAASISSAGSALPSPPVLRAPPSIPGTPQQGQTLTETAAKWTNSPTSITYQWYRCDSSTNNCVAIAGATTRSVVPTAADVGGTLQVSETASNAGGSATAYSPFAGPVMPSVGPIQVPASSSAPGISGPTQQGATLAESHATWTGNPSTFRYQWLRCAGGCSPVPGATSQTYTLGPGDVGFALEVQEFASNSGGAGGPATSNATGVVTATSTTALVAPERLVTNQQVTLVATVTSSSGNAAPSGSVSFSTASGPIPGCGGPHTDAAGQSATVTCQTSFATGIVEATAVFSAAGGSPLTGSSSQASTIAVGTAPTVTHLTAPGQTSVRSTIKYTASVAPNSSPTGPLALSGTVTFLDGGKAIHGCSGRSLVKASASCQVRYTALGTHRITASYAGSADFAASTSTVGRVTVGKPSPNYVTSVMRWYVHYTPSYTRFTSWLAYGVPAGSSLYFTCHGKGCPFATHILTVANPTHCNAKGKTKPCPASRTVNLAPIFSGVRLVVGTTVTVSILRCGWYGKHYALKIRSRRGPSSAISNLPIEVARPGIKC